MARLAMHAEPGAGHGAAARFGDFVATFLAMNLPRTGRQLRPRQPNRVVDGIIDLILNGPVRGPAAGHHAPPEPEDMGSVAENPTPARRLRRSSSLPRSRWPPKPFRAR